MLHNVVLRTPTEAVVVTIKGVDVAVDVVILTPVVANIFKETLTVAVKSATASITLPTPAINATQMLHLHYLHIWLPMLLRLKS